MDRKSLIFVGLAVTITLQAIPITAQPNAAPRNSETPRQTDRSSNQQRRESTDKQQQRQEVPSAPVAVINNPNTQQKGQSTSNQTANPDFWWRTSAPAEWALVIVGGLTALAAFKTLRRIKDEIELTRGLAEAAQRQAIAAEESAAVSRRTADLTYQALNMTHRAKIVVRNVVVPNLLDFATALVGGELWVTNVGYTPAMILKTYATWIIDETLPMENPANAAVVGEHQSTRRSYLEKFCNCRSPPPCLISINTERSVRVRERRIWLVW